VTTAETPERHHTLVWVGIATAGLGALPVWTELAREPERLTQPRYVAWLILFAIFLATFAITTLTEHHGRLLRLGVLLAVQSASAVALSFLLNNTLTSVLLVIVASQLSFLSLGPSLAWIAVQTAVFAYGMRRDIALEDVLMVAAVFAGFQLFALYTFRIAERERRARSDLAQAHESLLATRQLLAETTRTAERLRIARELHDVLGHHLTALSLHLEAALHAPESTAARERVATAQQLAKGLLSEVREVVSTLREEEAKGSENDRAGAELRLAAALAALSAGVEEPRVHLTVQPEAGLNRPDAAHALLRCAQEIFTNAMRHAGARNLWLEVTGGGADGGEGMTLRARDDGRGAPEIVPGHGLRGMRERIEKLGGRLDVASTPGAGFEVTVHIPERP
jgi:signal transduction histidine kinase